MIVDKIINGKYGSWEAHCRIDKNKAPLLVQVTKGNCKWWIDMTRMTQEEAANFGVKIRIRHMKKATRFWKVVVSMNERFVSIQEINGVQWGPMLLPVEARLIASDLVKCAKKVDALKKAKAKANTNTKT